MMPVLGVLAALALLATAGIKLGWLGLTSEPTADPTAPPSRVAEGAKQVALSFASLCDVGASPLRTEEDLRTELERLRAFLLIAPALPGYPDTCLLAMPAALSKRAVLDLVNPELSHARPSDVGSEVVWGFAAHLLSWERGGRPTSELRERFTQSVSQMYPDSPDLAACVRDEMAYAIGFLDHALLGPENLEKVSTLLSPVNQDGRDRCYNF